jgi:hypothetical protein
VYVYRGSIWLTRQCVSAWAMSAYAPKRAAGHGSRYYGTQWGRGRFGPPSALLKRAARDGDLAQDESVFGTRSGVSASGARHSAMPISATPIPDLVGTLGTPNVGQHALMCAQPGPKMKARQSFKFLRSPVGEC